MQVFPCLPINYMIIPASKPIKDNNFINNSDINELNVAIPCSSSLVNVKDLTEVGEISNIVEKLYSPFFKQYSP